MNRPPQESEALEDLWQSRSDDEEGGLSLPPFLLDPIGVVRRRWLWMLLTVVVGIVGTVALVSQLKPAFMAQATVLITSQQIPEEFVRSTVREDSISNINAMVGKVLSQENLARILDEHGLYPELRADQPQVEVLSRLRGDITVEPQSSFSNRDGSLIYSVAFEYTEPSTAADVANALAAVFTEANIQRRNEQARRTTEFLARQLESEERELRETGQAVSEFRRAHRGALPSELETNLRRLDSLADRRTYLITQISQKESHLITLAAIPSDRERTHNEKLLDELRRDLAMQEAANTDLHPNVIALRERVAHLDAVVRQEREDYQPGAKLRGMIDAERRELDMLRRQKIETEAAITELTANIDRTPTVGEELSALERKEKVLRENYESSLRKVEEAEVAESLESAQQGARVSILDRAQTPTKPKRPRWQLMTAGIAFSLVLALWIALGMEFVDPVLITAKQLEDITERPVLGALPRIA